MAGHGLLLDGPAPRKWKKRDRRNRGYRWCRRVIGTPRIENRTRLRRNPEPAAAREHAPSPRARHRTAPVLRIGRSRPRPL